MQTPLRTPLRIGQPGDITLLLEPVDPVEIKDMRKHQFALQEHYGGELMEPVHLTCQRFTLNDEQYYPWLLETLTAFAAQYEPFTLQAQGLLPFYSEYRQVSLLKWEVVLDPRLESFSARLEHILMQPWITSLYTPGWVSTLVTALVNINPETTQPLERLSSFPHPLFMPGILTISKLQRPSEFEIMDKLPLWTS
ncbi:MAG: hypothetical protein MUC85_11760 [Anaerolineales bacterium]|jgi:hypothetical protein|nr:hypothetical protein [Anaerolineales bacterium]